MTKPRRIIPGTTVLVTRRTTQQRFLLRPEPFVNDTFEFLLAHAANVHDVPIHGYTVMSNHPHIELTDEHGNLPDFMQLLDGLLARALNAYRGRFENFFSSGSYSFQRLESPADVLDKLVYTLTNPVKDGLVSHSKDWKGATSVRWPFGKTRTFDRPRGRFFDPNGRLPERVSLKLTAPPLGLSDEEATRVVREAVRRREMRFREERKAAGNWFMGMADVERVDPESRPRSRAPRFNLDPRVAAKDREQRKAAIAELKEFESEYRDAWLEWRDGERDEAVFPYGTWLMRVKHRAPCRPPPPS